MTTVPLNIMIIEDNDGFRDAISLAISREPSMQLLGSFTTAEHALEALDTEPVGTADIILLDLHLPRMSGLESLPKFLKRSPHSKVIILTQSSEKQDVEQAISLGSSGYLLKSASVREIKRCIHKVAAGGAYLDPDIAKYILASFKAKSSDVTPEIQLSKREMQILELLSDGLPKKQISHQLNIAYDTVDTHVRRIYSKLEVSNAPAAISKAFRTGVLDA